MDVSGLKPESPPLMRKANESCYEIPMVTSLQPILSWERLSDAWERISHSGDVAKVTQLQDVTYDLKVWRVEQGQADELVYDRNGLISPSHQIEIPLEHAAEYFWTVRAHFQLDGRPRLTPWATVRSGPCCPSCSSFDDPYFRFKTPSEPDARTS